MQLKIEMHLINQISKRHFFIVIIVAPYGVALGKGLPSKLILSDKSLSLHIQSSPVPIQIILKLKSSLEVYIMVWDGT